MSERFFIAPLIPPVDKRCELCNTAPSNLYIQDLNLEHGDHIRYVHDTCLAAFCEYNHIRPPDSFVKYCIDKLGLGVKKGHV